MVTDGNAWAVCKAVGNEFEGVAFRNALLQAVGGLVALEAAWDDAVDDDPAGLPGKE